MGFGGGGGFAEVILQHVLQLLASCGTQWFQFRVLEIAEFSPSVEVEFNRILKSRHL